MWDIGNRSPSGAQAVNIARLWVENAPTLEPGGRAAVRLVPLDPAQWQHVKVGQQITMHEDLTVAGTATILEVHAPESAMPSS
ncbi:hypothetical protein PV417_08220 [Streptomyces sp. ME19-03-3]|nr:hypothetical protein [Streptomyces sp. ME19-03-3]